MLALLLNLLCSPPLGLFLLALLNLLLSLADISFFFRYLSCRLLPAILYDSIVVVSHRALHVESFFFELHPCFFPAGLFIVQVIGAIKNASQMLVHY